MGDVVGDKAASATFGSGGNLDVHVANGFSAFLQIRKDDEIILKVPVNVGIIGGIIGAAAAPWALIAGTVAAFGFGCKLEIVKKDGTTDEIV